MVMKSSRRIVESSTFNPEVLYLRGVPVVSLPIRPLSSGAHVKVEEGPDEVEVEQPRLQPQLDVGRDEDERLAGVVVEEEAALSVQICRGDGHRVLPILQTGRVPPVTENMPMLINDHKITKISHLLV